MTENIDPRPYYDRALRWIGELIAAVEPDQLDGPTPCPDFDVRTLIGHIVGTVDRARVIGAGGAPFSVPSVVTGVPDDGWVAALRTATERMWEAWRDDTRLEALVTVPWGTVPGRAALGGYLNEAVVHGWDLAVATGQDPEADSDLALAALAGAEQKIPADRRGGPIPFGPVVEPEPDAPPTERLANWNGRATPARTR